MVYDSETFVPAGKCHGQSMANFTPRTNCLTRAFWRSATLLISCCDVWHSPFLSNQPQGCQWVFACFQPERRPDFLLVCRNPISKKKTPCRNLDLTKNHKSPQRFSNRKRVGPIQQASLLKWEWDVLGTFFVVPEKEENMVFCDPKGPRGPQGTPRCPVGALGSKVIGSVG